MLGLAVLALLGRSWSLPVFVRRPSIERGDTASVFALGVFSGIASSCCAPVIAGVMALSALSGSLVGAGTLGLAYVFGMVFPLFLMAVLWDRLRLGERRPFTARPLQLRLAGRTVHTNTVNVAVAAAFAVMGIFVLYLAWTGNTTTAPPFQVAIGDWLADTTGRVVRWLDPVPEPILGLGLLAVAASFFVVAARDRRHDIHGGTSHEHQDEDHEQAFDDEAADVVAAPRGSCHDDPTRAVDERTTTAASPR
jgi:hypothetical protein